MKQLFACMHAVYDCWQMSCVYGTKPCPPPFIVTPGAATHHWKPQDRFGR
jgi:hypothetical protein